MDQVSWLEEALQREATRRSTLLVPFLSSLLMVPAGLALMGAL